MDWLPKRNSSRRIVWSILMLWGVGAPCTVALPADAEPLGVVPTETQTASDRRSTTDTDNTSALQEIIVTARKRDERLQDVPVSVTAFTAQDIQRYQTQTLTDVAALTPQLILGSGVDPSGDIVLRGIGASDSSPAVDQPVSINIDGVQVSNAQIIRLAQLDLQQIEVLKGPQTLFFGKNSPAGVISMTSADPGDSFEAKIRTGYEIYNQQEFLEGLVSGPVNDVLAARLDLYGTTQKGWFVNVVPEQPGVTIPQVTTYPDYKEFSGRLTVTYTPSEMFDARLKFNDGRLDQKEGTAAGEQLYRCPLGTPQTAFGYSDPDPCKLSRYFSLGATSPQVAALDGHFGDGQPFLTSAQELGSLTANYHPLKELTVTSVTAYYKDAEDYMDNFCRSVVSCLPAFSFVDINQWTQELRARTSFSGPLNFMVGGYYQYLELTQADGYALGVPLVTTPVMYENYYAGELTHSRSGFGQIIYDFAQAWELTAGGRYTSENKGESYVRYPSLLNGFGPAAAVPLQVTKVAYDDFSPEATLTYKPTNDITIYAAYRHGFVAGGFNIAGGITAGTDNSYKPETAKGGEVGVKGLVLDRQLRFDTDAYYYKYSELQLSTFDPVTLSQPILNAGAATIYGLETSLEFVPRQMPQLSLRGSAAYNHNQYNSFIASCYGGQTVALGCDLNPADGHYNSQSLAGAPLSRAPTWAASIGASYESRINDRIALGTSVDADYTGSYFTIPEEDPRGQQGSFWKLNLNVSLRGRDHAWEVALIGKNLTNKLNVVSTFGTPFTGGGFGTVGPIVKPDLDGSIDAPRTVMVQFTMTNAIFRK
jgi:iron complex outermembrane receptor protein